MLVLSRKQGEGVCLDGQIVVSVSEIRGHSVRLAISAPDHVEIVRDELNPTLRENIEATNARADSPREDSQRAAKT